jgi:hypothetical protein
MLQFRVSTSSANNLRFRVTINDTQVFTYGPSDENLTRDFLEVVSGVRDGANSIGFTVVGGSGFAIISDIVLWYRLTV